VISEELEKIYINENTTVIRFYVVRGGGKKAFQKPVENFSMLLKNNVEKMSTFLHATMFMKTNKLSHSRHDVDEKKDG